MPAQAGGRVIFIGNIPYGLTEEQITEIFSTCGQIKSFRLVYHKDTHQPKGYGFLEYADADSAATAKRNLDQYEAMGRKLRVDFTNESGASEGAINNTIHSSSVPAPPSMGAPDGSSAPGSLPPLPSGQELPPGVSCADAISRTLNAVPAPQLLDILSSMRGMATSEPQKAVALLQSAPQLAYAMFQALLLLGLVDTNVLQSAIGQASQQQQQQQQQQQHIPPPPPPMQPQHMAPYANPPSAPPAQYGMPYGAPPVPPPQMNMSPAPPQNAYQQRGPLRFNFPPDLPAETRSTVEQIFALSNEQVNGLDAGTRAQVEQVRSSFRHLLA